MSDPVTIVLRRKVKPGREADYEAWLKRLTEGAASRFSGYLGAEFHRPGANGAYRSVFRFDSIDRLDAFERSDFRMQMLNEAEPLFDADAAWERMTGLEFWFDPPADTKVPQPSPHRMALGPFMTGWPIALRVLVTVTIQVGLMTYVIMPRLTPMITRFIDPKTKTL
ncbi:antibiotic biosynthesis monooxygenase (plasmid) [Peteryoungia desertarenae]|uniref:Antibiotic biosynthesis monooxygenase n=1 Tax=Peteryoungia desertarenae TaxID=1813451 RepID=A0ABX6QSF5_9HYPH|nr:antibiotic biosynthesis monooxygenase [Peteryoungia desertarenae]QLF71591.1 antibiotic biosynthesis monooxygenase [Peteryoungia desertarenae]